MIRTLLLAVVVLAVMITATRRWYGGLCGLVLLTVLLQNPNFPTNMFGVQGLNPWNLTCVVVAACWLTQRRAEAPAAPLPSGAYVLLALYVALIVLTSAVAAADIGSFHSGRWTITDVLVNGLINPLKYLLVGVMFADGARTRPRVRLALGVAVGSGILYALLLFKTIKGRLFGMDFNDARRLTDKLVGLHANDLGQLLAFTLWAGLLLWLILPRGWLRVAWPLAVSTVVPPFLAVQSRAGFLAFAAAGLTLGALRWRRLLILLPAAAGAVAVARPDVVERVGMGIVGEDQVDWDTVSAGRVTNIWPPVWAQIGESPLVGHGRWGLLRTPCYFEVLAGEGSVPTHPHNAYLELMLDAGTIGLLIGLACAVGLLWTCGWLMRRGADREATTLGAVGLIAVVVYLSAGVAGLSFFPTQSTVPYLCVWGAVLRVAGAAATAPQPIHRRAAGITARMRRVRLTRLPA